MSGEVGERRRSRGQSPHELTTAPPSRRLSVLRPGIWDWSDFVDGSLAVDRHDLWEEPPIPPRIRLLQAPDRAGELPPGKEFVTVRRMPPARRTRELRRARRERRAARRLQRVAILALVGVIAVITLLLTAFGTGTPTRVASTAPAPAQRLLPTGPPAPLIVAIQGALRLQLPIAQSKVTAIGYHAAGEGTLALHPLGRQSNAGLLSRLAHKIFGGGSSGLGWYQLEGGSGPQSSSLDVGAAAGTDVYSPVDGQIVGITDYIVNNRVYGRRIDIEPTAAPAIVVSVTHLRPDSSLTVGSSVAARSSRLGTLLDLSRVEKQALARYTNDAGNHVSIEVHPSVSLSLP
jgi:hypothetical protein